MLFAYIDHISRSDTTLNDFGDPITALAAVQTRQLAERATLVWPDANTIRCTFSEDRTVRFAAALNVDLDSGDTLNVILYDSSVVEIAQSNAFGPPILDTNLYTRSLYYDFGQAYTNVRNVDFFFGLSGGVDHHVGRLWAGPAFVPANIQAASFGFGVQDPSGISISRGGQAYADPYQRLRTLRATLPALSQVEAFGDIDDTDVLNAQDLLFTVGQHGELIIVPYDDSAGDSTLLYKWALYGHLTGFSDITPVRPGDGNNTGRLFDLSLDAIEER